MWGSNLPPRDQDSQLPPTKPFRCSLSQVLRSHSHLVAEEGPHVDSRHWSCRQPFGAREDGTVSPMDLCSDGAWSRECGGLPGAFHQAHGQWYRPREGTLWAFSKESLRDGESRHTLNSASVPRGVAVRPPCSMGRRRLETGRRDRSVGGHSRG